MKTKQSLTSAFACAFTGLFKSVKEQRNLKIHVCIAVLAVILSIVFSISVFEWLVVLIFIALVISLELINTALEAAVDFTGTQIDPLAKTAKDACAASVLVSAICSVVAGCVIFVPKILNVVGF